MKNSTKLISTLALAVGLSIGASAAPVQITIQDNDSTLWGFNGAGSLTAGGTSGAGNFGTAHEDNETESGTISGQQWDMEAFVVNGTQLSIVAGFDLLNGVQSHNIGPGDLFIKVGGSAPAFNPTNQGAGNVTNSLYSYTYAIDLSPATRFTNSSFGSSAQVYGLSSTTVLNTTIYDQFGSNPWKYDNTLNTTLGFGTGITYQTGLANNAAALTALGLSLQGGYHNLLTIDLSFLSVPANTNVYFSYTMECGNDSLKGRYSGGFDQVPDSGTSALLMGLGLSALAIVGIKRRRA